MSRFTQYILVFFKLADLGSHFVRIKCGCGAVYQIKSEYAGKTLKCRACKKVFRVPAQPSSPNPQPQTQSASNYWVKPGLGQVPNQQKSNSNKRQQPPRKSSPQKPSTKAQREQALLGQLTSGSDLQQRMKERQRSTIEEDRVSNGISYIIYGVGWFVAAALAFWILGAVDNHVDGLRGGRVMVVLLLLYYLNGQYWIPALIATIGLFNLAIGIGSLRGRVDIVEEDLPVV